MGGLTTKTRRIQFSVMPFAIILVLYVSLCSRIADGKCLSSRILACGIRKAGRVFLIA